MMTYLIRANFGRQKIRLKISLLIICTMKRISLVISLVILQLVLMVKKLTQKLKKYPVNSIYSPLLLYTRSGVISPKENGCKRLFPKSGMASGSSPWSVYFQILTTL